MSFLVSFQLTDAFGRTTRKTFGNDRTLLADVESDVDAMVTLLQAASELVVTETKISVVEAIAASPTAGSNLDAGATLHCRLSNNKMYPLKVPGIEMTLINTDGSVDLTASAITNLVGAFASGQHWTVSEGDTIGSVVYGELDR